MTPHQEFIKVEINDLHLAQRAFPQANFVLLQHPDRISDQSAPLVRSQTHVDLPHELIEHIDFVYGLNHHSGGLPFIKAQRRRRRQSTKQSVDKLSGIFVSAVDSNILVQLELTEPTKEEFTLELIQKPANARFFTVKGDGTTSTLSYLIQNVANVESRLNVLLQDGTKIAYESVIVPGPLITPDVARTLYGVPRGSRGVVSSNSQSVAEFDGQYYSPSDLNQFLTLNGLPNITLTLAGDGGNDPSQPGGESTLDVDWITGIGVGIDTVFWSVGEGGFLLEWAMQMAASSNPPLVASISYGEPELYISTNMTDRIDSEFEKLGVRGVTILSTSGDIGVSDGSVCLRDIPDYPSSSPATTSLGATRLTRDTQTPICSGQYSLYNGAAPFYCAEFVERPCAADLGDGFTTGGGFSRRYNTPSWQIQAVQEYINTTQSSSLPPANWFNQKGRGYNDIASLGDLMMIVFNNEISTSGGTSASGPLSAGIIALLNDQRLSNNLPPLGFINPLLYKVASEKTKYPGAFNRAEVATNKCKELGAFGEASCCQYGFSSTPQLLWDPLVGLGSIQYGVWKDIVTNDDLFE
mmetsp:Transcript_10314/g.15543  ORF Transcript_10314/g.15543 Transcript_10314/m.15543 type:complete len:581 (+) Transcript_10314:379-2121(+)